MCELIDELKKLKKSSSESIDNEKSFTSFKSYMHIERPLQIDLEQIIVNAESNPKALILVCGNVGDGKSHLISYLKNEKKLLDDFAIHNDATESYSRNQTERQALAEALRAFNDDNIDDDSKSKVIVAINLGVLSNFIYSEEGKKFSRLRQYVESNRILVDEDYNSFDEEQSVFFHVNFGDYHLYQLNNGTVESQYISEIFNKVFGADENNPFYQKYLKCKSCANCDNCPVKTNYETMQNTITQRGIINILIEAIIKDKLIISTRELLNFIYDIIVHPAIDTTTYKGNYKVEYLLPNLLYDHAELSELLYHVSKYDLLKLRLEKLDEIITNYVNINNPITVFNDYIQPNPCLEAVKRNYNSRNVRWQKDPYLTLFVRLLRILPLSPEIKTVNEEYSDFVKYLYASKKGIYRQIKTLSKMVEDCVYKWTGSKDKKRFIINEVGDFYSISTKLNLRIRRTINCEKVETVYDKFFEKITLCFLVGSENNKTELNLSIDYELFEMLVKIHNGYIVSAKEKSYYATFFSFVERLIKYSKYKTELYINKIDGEKKSYRLFDSYDEYEDEESRYEFEEVI